jgi:pantoate kinase
MAMLGNTAFALSYSPDTQVDDCLVTKINTTGIKYPE